MKESIKQLLLQGNIIKSSYKKNIEDWVTNVEIYVLVLYGEAKVYVNPIGKDYPLNQIDDAIDEYMDLAMSEKNLRYMRLPAQLIVQQKHPDNVWDDEDPEYLDLVESERQTLIKDKHNKYMYNYLISCTDWESIYTIELSSDELKSKDELNQDFNQALNLSKKDLMDENKYICESTLLDTVEEYMLTYGYHKLKYEQSLAIKENFPYSDPKVSKHNWMLSRIYEINNSYNNLNYNNPKVKEIANDILDKAYDLGVEYIQITQSDDQIVISHTSDDGKQHANLCLDNDCDISYMYFDTTDQSKSQRKLFSFDDNYDIDMIVKKLKI